MKFKFVIVALVFLLFIPQIVFASNITVEGRITDQINNPVGQVAIVFIDHNGKTVAATVSDISGGYKISIAQGTYTITINGPRGSNIQEKSLSGQIITASTVRDFTLSIPVTKIAMVKKPLPINIIVGIIMLIVAVGVLCVVFWKKERVLPQPSGSNK